MPATHPAAAKSWPALLESIGNAAPEQANLALLEALLRLVAAGAGAEAHALFSALVDGELAISPASRCRPRLLRLLPLLSDLLLQPCPALPDLPEVETQGLRPFVERLEQQAWPQGLLDRQTTPPPLSAGWSAVPASFLHNWLQRGHGRLNQIRAEHQRWPQAANYLSDCWRILQQLCRSGQLPETTPLFQHYDDICAALAHPRQDEVSQAVLLLRLEVLLRLGQQEAAQRVLCEALREAPSLLEFFCGEVASARLIVAGALHDAFATDTVTAPGQVRQALAQRLLRSPTTPDNRVWHDFLDAWSRDFFARPENDDSYLQDYFPQQAALRDLGSAPAGKAEIAALESRLGCTLPPAYRNFLLASNGWLLPTSLEPLLPAMEVDWLVPGDWLEDCPQGGEISDAAYLQYGEHQHSQHFRGNYLGRALQISQGETQALLLVPAVQDAHGEWEAWIMDLRQLSARRYRDFFALMQALRNEKD